MFNTMMAHLSLVGSQLLELFVISAPWLLLGFFMAACIKAFVKTETLYRYLGGTGFGVSVKAALIGAPLPLCSCGVVPAALGLRASGASKNATVSFLVATPETGVDSVSFTYALMGPIMAIVRPIAAIFSAIVSGLLVGKAEQHAAQVERTDHKKAGGSCCSSQKTVPQPPNYRQKLQEGLRFAFGKMLRDVVVWLMLGLLVAALVQSYLPEDFFTALGDGFLSMLLMAVIGIPMYVCATGSTPIAAGFLLSGLSPGAVLVFMLLGPASNIGTLMIVKNELGARAVTAYLIGITLSAFTFGFLLNYLTAYFGWDFMSALQTHDHAMTTWWEWVAALVLAMVIAKALFDKVLPAKQAH
ncbi:Transporter [Methylophaga frappieri]|jgi:uncharacterized membrane protein YraQ (UPF0718 family)|uniref:Transporter n=1 Tax=Methylophaga frappieri (strain ATCC BAA-2434 / DSM 25690 / JAM7) TaxID=754477 RepID=I1YJB7_METFJ|nr:SO_0444 family Cu/Zn efflux transporter [Methylophaga frappieri]AFJ03010.1 Transporter [Methylophaga frappieri]